MKIIFACNCVFIGFGITGKPEHNPHNNLSEGYLLTIIKKHQTRTILCGTAFLGSFLLFCLEPYIGRKLTPLFGGSAHVWLVCLSAYQLLILAGYCYAHVASAKTDRLHLFLLTIPLMVLPVGMLMTFPIPDHSFLWTTLFALGLALPFVLLASTTVILQKWFGDSGEPYVIYGASNAGALTALISYPFVIEPLAGLRYQGILWMTGYVLYVLMVVFSFYISRPSGSENSMATKLFDAEKAGNKPSMKIFLYWTLLSGSTSAFLVTITNITISEIGSFPLVWMMPLALYLISFTVTFRPTCQAAFAFSRFWPETLLLGVVLFLIGSGRLWVHPGHWVVFFAVCVMLHRILYEQRPHPNYLSVFYMGIALGGSAGGMIASLAAPLIFPGFWEYPLLAVIMSILFIHRYGREMVSFWRCSSRRVCMIRFIPVLFLTGLAIIMGITAGFEDTRSTRRNYYGVSRVVDSTVAGKQGEIVRSLISGSTVHGVQFLDKRKKRIPTLYYHPESGLADIFKIIPSHARIAAIGLGVGAIGAYTRPNDLLHIYELNPEIFAMANQWFTYLVEAPARPRVMIGDGRLALQNQDIFYDLIFVDAFSGEGIPSHLLTREAIEIYRDRLKEHGVILFHVTNRYYDLRPVLKVTAKSLKLHVATKSTETILGEATKPVRADYLALTSDNLISQRLTNLGWVNADRMDTAINCRVWTDDYINMLVPLAAKWNMLFRK